MVEEHTPSLTIDEEDKVSHQPKKTSKSANSSGSSSGESSGGFSSILIFLLAASAVVASAFLFMQLQETNLQLDNARTQRAADQERLRVMEERLQITDNSVSETKTAADDKLSELDTEIRKLWDNVWKKSKAQLSEHEDSIASLKKSVAAVGNIDKQLDKLEKSLKANDAALAALKEQVNKDKSTVSTMAAQVKEALTKSSANRGELASLDLAVQGSVAQSKAAADKVEPLLKRVAELERRVQGNEEWVESINGHRRQVVRDIQELRQKLQDYQASPY